MSQRLYSRYKVKQPLKKKASKKYSPSTTVNTLPPELLLNIFSFLPVRSLQNAALVCQKWRRIASDNSLWESRFKRFFGCGSKSLYVKLNTLALDTYLIDHGIHWKQEFLNQCQIQTKKTLTKLKRSAYTGVTDNVGSFLTTYGINFQLCITTVDKVRHRFSVFKRTSNRSSTYIQWNSLDGFPLLSKIQRIDVYAMSPLILLKDKKFLPLKKALVHSVELEKDEQFVTIAQDAANQITLKKHLDFLVAVWKDSNNISFFSVCLHHHNLIKKCFFSSAEAIYQSKHSPIHDDIDQSYGMHGYKCHLLIHTIGKILWEDKFSYLSCTTDPGSGVLILKPDVRVGESFTHSKFKWKTELFKGAFDNIVLVDITMVDSNNEVMWAKSYASQVRQTSTTNVSLDSSASLYLLRCQDEQGFISVTFSKEDKTVAPEVVFGIAIAVIRRWFGRK